MNILSKFDSVKIESANRISENDMRFCIKQQEAYEAAGAFLHRLKDIMEDGINEQKNILSAIYNDDGYWAYTRYISEWNKIVELEDSIDKIHGRFIQTICSYFEDNYKVDIDGGLIKEHLIPSNPYSSYYTYDEEKEKQYRDKMDSLSIKYEQIVDEIFTQLGGFSFEEKAIRELKERCHIAVYNRYSDTYDYEMKKDTIKLTRYSCSHDDWYKDDTHWKLCEGSKNIVRGLWHFETGKIGKMNHVFEELTDYSIDGHEFNLPLFHKVKRVKLYKNGNVDIKFADSVLANEFANDYLRFVG